MKPLIRILLAVVVIVILTFLLLLKFTHFRNRVLEAQARSDVNAIEASIRGYYMNYGKLPVPDSQQGIPDKTYGSIEVYQITSVLEAITKGWNKANALNPKGIVFLPLSPHKNRWDKEGRILDPWGTPYWIALDNNGDGTVIYSNAVYSVTNSSVGIAVSFGPNGKPDDPAYPESDDIISGR